jgi:hypothetical protein
MGAMLVLASVGCIPIRPADRSMRKQIGFLAPPEPRTCRVVLPELDRRHAKKSSSADVRSGSSLSAGQPSSELFSPIVFGASSRLRGAARMFLIAIFGLMFSVLAWWRKSLRRE